VAEFFNNKTANETSLEGCPDPTAGRAVVLSGGHATRVCHQFRDGSGTPVDLLAYLDEVELPPPADDDDEPSPPPSTAHRVHFADAVCGAGRIITVDGEIDEDGDPSRVCFTVPDSVANHPGIYQAELIVVDAAGRPQASDSTLISVERSLHLRTLRPGDSLRGPLTLGEIRTQLRDFPVLNSYWQNVEFSDAEILHAIIEPIRCFNETLPRVLSYGPANFPFRHNWLQAVCAALLRISANSYMRNSRRITYGDNKTTDDRDKFSAYAQMAETKWREYQMFCSQQQVAANWTGSAHMGNWMQ
jgi:hypothetical protein